MWVMRVGYYTAPDQGSPSYANIVPALQSSLLGSEEPGMEDMGVKDGRSMLVGDVHKK